MAFTVAEKERIRYHLGYLNVQLAASIQFGIPRPLQTVFILEEAMDNIIAQAEDRVRRILNIMDGAECRLVDAMDRLAATQLGDLHLRDSEPDLLEKEYQRWGKRLADIMGVPLYAYSERYKYPAGPMAGSIPVRR